MTVFNDVSLNILYELISERYEVGSLIITNNSRFWVGMNLKGYRIRITRQNISTITYHCNYRKIIQTRRKKTRIKNKNIYIKGVSILKTKGSVYRLVTNLKPTSIKTRIETDALLFSASIIPSCLYAAG